MKRRSDKSAAPISGRAGVAHRRVPALLALVAAMFLTAPVLFAASRVPKPDFYSDYKAPQNVYPRPRPGLYELLDVVVLAGALAAGAWLVFKRRSRNGVYALMVFCLLYFGFWKRGCVCAVGSIQNVVDSVANPGHAISLGVILFFALPLLCALFFGRVFCAAVCPLGAIQDVVAFRPRRISPWLAEALSLFPYVYLGLAVLLAATQTAYLICRYDPFVAFFRFSGPAYMFYAGAVLLGLGVVVARPYCRFLCPYGVLLAWASRLSWKRVTVTPTECIRCRLCEDACPFDVIRRPVPKHAREARRAGIRRTALSLAVTPLLMLLGGWLCSHLGGPLSLLSEDAQVSQALALEAAGKTKPTVDTTAFQDTGRSTAELRADVAKLRHRLNVGGAWLGVFLGLVIGVKLVSRSILLQRRDYEAERGTCLACTRCYRFCPMEAKRKTPPPEEEAPNAAQA